MNLMEFKRPAHFRPPLSMAGAASLAVKWALEMTEEYMERPGVREEFEKWLVEYEAKKQNAPTAADRESALPGTEIADSAPEKVIVGMDSIAQIGRNCNV